MKTFKVFLILFTTAMLINACDPIEECDTNDYGSVTIINDLDEAFVFDVTYEQNEDGDWLNNYEVKINVGESYTWNEVDAGDIRIWLDLGDETWMILEDTKLSKCDNKEITYEEQCSLLGTGYATVKNETGSIIVVEVKYKQDANQGFIGEVKLNHGEAVTYNAPAGDVEFWAREINSEEWVISSESYPLAECGEFTFTWEAKKAGTYKQLVKPEYVQETTCERKVMK